MLLGGEPSARRVCLYKRAHSSNMQQQQLQRQQQQQQLQQEQQQQQQQEQQLQADQPANLKLVLPKAQQQLNSLVQLKQGSKGKESTPPNEGVVKSASQPGVSIEQLFEDVYTFPAARNTPYHSSSRGHNEHVTSASSITAHAQDALGITGSRTLPSSRVVAAQRRLAKMSLTVPLSISSASKASAGAAISTTTSSSSLDPNALRKKASSIPSLPSATAASVSHRRSSDVSGALTSARALTSRGGRASAGGVGGGGGRSGSGGLHGAGGEIITPVSGTVAVKEHGSRLTEREKVEVKSFKTVYFLGHLSSKMAAREQAEKNEGHDDKDGFYVCKPRDHLLYRYEIQDVLGKGTFGQVVKAWDHKTNSLVAMKIVKNEKPFLKQAKEEVRILEVLKKQDKHDLLNIVHILDSFKFRGHVCIAFELLGISLHQLLKKTRGQGFNLNRIQKLTRGILRCLELLAKNRIIHCDIKPENILLRRSAHGLSASTGAGFSDASIKVIDFGSSCYEQQQIYTYIQSRYYRAPEVILGARYTCAIDMWSLACVIGELFTTQPLFGGDDEHDQLASIMEVRGRPPGSLMGRCKRWDKFFSGLDTPRYLQGHGKAARRGAPSTVSLSSALKHTEDPVFLDFMQKALTWDPVARLTAADALQHAWILRGQGSKALAAATEAKGSMDLPRTKSSDKAARTDLLQGTRRQGGGGGSSSSSTASKTASASLRSTHSGSSHGVGSLNNNAVLTAKLPSHLVRPRSDTTALLQKARAGPAIGLPPWDAR